MSSRLLASLCLLSAIGFGIYGGYSWWRSQPNDEMTEDMTAEASPEPAPAIEKPPVEPEQTLALNLKVGDRFPLIKTVVQQLKQPSPQGWSTSESKLEMLLHLTVEQIIKEDPNLPETHQRDGQKRLQVKYHRVQFSQNIPGHEINYDSANPPEHVPLEAQGYHGLKDNSFQFWIGPDNQILQMVGFELFLDRCLKDVAPAQRQQVRAILASTSGADGIANFVDDSIGLLPAHAVRKDEKWTRTRQLQQPVPMHVTTDYTLRSITPQMADIDIIGRISPSATYGPSDQSPKAVQVSIRGGHCFGSCQIDRRTGLPMQSKVEQNMQMHVRLAGGIEFDQNKTTITTINAYIEGAPPRVVEAPASAPGGIVREPQTGSTYSRTATVPGQSPRR